MTLAIDSGVAIITGGAGSVGSSVARALKEDGYTVVIADLDRAHTSSRAAELGTEWFSADLTSEASAQALVDHARQFGDITALVNAAGISPKVDGRKMYLQDITAEHFMKVLSVNLVGMFCVIKATVPHMPADGRSVIVNIGSISARSAGAGPSGTTFGLSMPAGLHYTASKAAVHNMSASLSRELAPQQIRVNTVAPGFIRSEMTAAVGANAVDEIVGQVPAGRGATPDEIAAGIRYLVSAQASYVSGAVLDMNGAWLPQF